MTIARLSMSARLIDEKYSNYSLLDMGCRTMALKQHLNGCSKYYGTDFIPAENVYECNLEEGLKQFEDSSFDIVCALDVLEHLEHCHFALEEALRVAKKAVIISLPNMFYIKFRLNFLFGKNLSGKYRFPMDPIMDRHRWVLSYRDSIKFVEHIAKDYKISVHQILPTRQRTRVISEPIEKILAKIWPNLFVYGGLFLIEKNGS